MNILEEQTITKIEKVNENIDAAASMIKGLEKYQRPNKELDPKGLAQLKECRRLVTDLQTGRCTHMQRERLEKLAGLINRHFNNN